jgi:hypothetical protein
MFVQVGAGHSWSDVAKPVCIQMSLDKLNRVIQINKDAMEVTVEVIVSDYLVCVIAVLQSLLFVQDLIFFLLAQQSIPSACMLCALFYKL